MQHGIIIAIFDLPMETPEGKKTYHQLIKQFESTGFQRIQYSVFMKYQHNMKTRKTVIHQFERFRKVDGSLSFFFMPIKAFNKSITIAGSKVEINCSTAEIV